MKILILVLALGGFSFAQADSTAFFQSSDKGKIVLQNGTTADADFFWDIFAVEVVKLGLNESKTFASPEGDFKAVCNRALTTPAPLTSCTLDFANVPLGGVVKISRDENRISGLFNSHIASAFVLPEVLVKSPDGSMTVCSACGLEGADLSFSIRWEK